MAVKQLAAVLYGRHVADVWETSYGQHHLRYTADRGVTPVSLSMPLAQDEHVRPVDAFLAGLLPDDPEVRRSIGAQFGVSGENPFALLAQIGMDCAGGVQFCAPDLVEATLAREGELVPVSEVEIGARLRAFADHPGGSWLRSEERWSLAGAQSKLALRSTDEGWAEARGSAATTHIVKPGVPRLRLQALNEHVCLAVAGRVGLAAASSVYTEFDGVPALVVERYDRQRLDDGRVARVHQEDVCQALAVPPTRKYEADGGPGAPRVLSLLSGPGMPAGAAMAFAGYLAFNYLAGATDAHVKNYSLMLIGPTPRLAPLYDVASVFPYEPADPTRLDQMAMAIGGERVIGKVTDRHWAKLATTARLDPDWLVDVVHELAERVPDAAADVLADGTLRTLGATELANRLLPKLAANCRAASGSRRAARSV